MSLKTYRIVNSFFNSYNSEKFFQEFFKKYPNIDTFNENKENIIANITDFFNSYHSNDIDPYPYIKSTIYHFLNNKPFGEKKLTSLEKILMEEYLNIQFLLSNDRYLYKYIQPFISQVKNHTFLWFYYAVKTEFQTYKEANIVIPAGYFINRNPFKFMDLPFNSYNFNKIGIKKKDIEVFDGKWQMNKEWMDVKKIINKYFFNIENMTKNQKVKKIYKTPIGDFFEIKKEIIDERESTRISLKNFFFYGKTQQFIETFRRT